MPNFLQYVKMFYRHIQENCCLIDRNENSTLFEYQYQLNVFMKKMSDKRKMLSNQLEKCLDDSDISKDESKDKNHNKGKKSRYLITLCCCVAIILVFFSILGVLIYEFSALQEGTDLHNSYKTATTVSFKYSR